MLTDIIPASWRKTVYALYAVVGVVLGAWQLAQSPVPGWLLTALTVYGFVGTAIGAVASANTKTAHVARNERGAFDALLVLVVLTFVGVVLLLFKVHFGG